MKLLSCISLRLFRRASKIALLVPVTSWMITLAVHFAAPRD